MGIYDSVWVDCPDCNHKLQFQSKSGPCELKSYTLDNAPEDVLQNVNRHSPIQCPKCKRYYEIHFNPLQIAEVKL